MTTFADTDEQAAASDQSVPPVADRRAEKRASSVDTQHIRGMMPSFDVWEDAQATLAVENEAARRWHEVNQRRRAPRTKGSGGRRLLVISVVVVVAVGAVILATGHGHDPAPTASTPVDQLPWRDVETPSGNLRVALPAKPAVEAVSSLAGTGQQLRAAVPGYEVTVAAFTLASGPNEARALISPLIRQRADLLRGHVDSLDPVNSRVGEAFEAVIADAAPLAIVRVVLDGLTLYILQIRGDVAAPRAHQIYDQMVQSFTPMSTR